MIARVYQTLRIPVKCFQVGQDWPLDIYQARPRLYQDEQHLAVPPSLRVIGRLGHIADFLDLTAEDEAAD